MLGDENRNPEMFTNVTLGKALDYEAYFDQEIPGCVYFPLDCMLLTDENSDPWDGRTPLLIMNKNTLHGMNS